MFWFLKKGENHSVKIKELDKVMKSSFYNVKQDIGEISLWLKDIHSTHKYHSTRLELYDQRLLKIEQKLARVQEHLLNLQKPTQSQINETENSKQLIYNKDILEGLTDTHKHLFKTIYHLQSQLGGNAVSFKSLASMAYAGKDYGQIRSTISQYLNSLYQMGLIDKKRYGKEAFISLTDLGLSIVDKKDLVKLKYKEGSKKSWQNI